WDQLKKIIEILPEYRFAYLMSGQDPRLVFLVDSEPLGSPDRSMPGDIYDDASLDFQNAFKEKEESFSGPDTDRWGTWVTITVPILDPRSGDLLAMFCLDRNAADWTSSLFKDRLKGIGLVLVLSIFVLLGFLVFGRVRPLDKKFFYAETFYVAGFCLLMTICVFFSTSSKSRHDLSFEFQQVAIEAAQIFSAEMSTVRADLDYLLKFFTASQNVDRTEFHLYASDLVRDYIGRQAFAWLPRVRSDEVVLYEQEAKEEGVKDFFIFEKSKAGERMRVTERPEYFPLYYLEPLSDDKAAIGFDAYSEPMRREALIHTQRSGLKCTTGWINFVVNQEERKSGLLVYQPVYEKKEASGGGQTSQALKGFLMAAIRPQAMLEEGFLNGFRGKRQLAEVIVLDLNDLSGVKAVASYPRINDLGKDKGKDLLKRKSGEMKEITLVSFFGNSYAIVATPNGSFFDEHPQRLPWVVLWGGLFLTGALTLLSYVLQNARRRAEEIVLQRTAELIESEERFRSLFDNMGDGVAIYKGVDDGNDFVFVDLNRTGQAISQVSRDTVMGRRITDVFPGVQNIGLLNALMRVWKTGVSEMCPESLYRDGRIEQWVENFVCKLPSGLVATIFTDVTSLKRTEQALVTAHEQMRSVLDAATRVSIISTDLFGIIKTFNRGAENLLGYRLEEVVGKQVYSLLHLEAEMLSYGKELSQELGYPVSGFEVFVARVKKGSTEEHDWTYVKKDGTSLVVNLVVTAIKDVTGAITGFLGIATDITERKQFEQNLKNSFNELKQFHAATINRESRIIELKKEINALYVKLGQKPPYDLSFLGEG
ncbi:MAG: CHASE domain-containing protein, partial [Candidatus Omnitrophota bacterium]